MLLNGMNYTLKILCFSCNFVTLQGERADSLNNLIKTTSNMFSYLKKRWITTPIILQLLIICVPILIAMGCYYLRDFSILDLPSLNKLRAWLLIIIVLLIVAELRTAAKFAFEVSFYKKGEYCYRGLYCILYAKEKNYVEAVKNFLKAAEQGNAEAQYILGFCYEIGQGVPQDYEEAVKWYRLAAEQGNADAKWQLGCCYERGYGVPKDIDEALKWYRLAAEQGVFIYQYALGRSFEAGDDGFPQDYKEAVMWYLKASVYIADPKASKHEIWYRKLPEYLQRYRIDGIGNVNVSSALYVLAKCYEEGRGVPQDKEEAERLYIQAAKRGNREAKMKMRELWGINSFSWIPDIKSSNLKPSGAKKKSKVVRLLALLVYFVWAPLEINRFFGPAFWPSDYQKGLNYEHGINFTSKNEEEAVKWFRKAARAGDDNAQFSLGYCYAEGHGVQQDYEEAVKWYSLAAEHGNVSAQNNLGVCYATGHGVTQDEEKAVKWYRKSAEQGNDVAQSNLGFYYLNGKGGLPQDYEEAVKWFRKSAKQGYAPAQYNLGYCYEDGLGVTQNYTTAVKWYQKAAKQENPDALYCLGRCFEEGHGVQKNVVEAQKFYRKAAKLGNEDAKEKLEEPAERMLPTSTEADSDCQ